MDVLHRSRCFVAVYHELEIDELHELDRREEGRDARSVEGNSDRWRALLLQGASARAFDLSRAREQLLPRLGSWRQGLVRRVADGVDANNIVIQFKRSLPYDSYFVQTQPNTGGEYYIVAAKTRNSVTLTCVDEAGTPQPVGNFYLTIF